MGEVISIDHLYKAHIDTVSMPVIYPDVSRIGQNMMNIDFGGYPARIYFLPGVPADAGELPQEPSCNLEGILSKFIPLHKENVQQLMRVYGGRKMDVAGVLYYAKEQGRFDEFVTRLEDEYSSKFSHIPSILQFARTDMTRFFMELYYELGKGDLDSLQAWRDIDAKGPGVVILIKPEGLD